MALGDENRAALRQKAVERVRQWRLANPEKAAALRLKEKLRNAKPPHPRQVAIAAGASLYFTGVPCRKGHVAERYVCNKKCRVCFAEKMSRRYQQNKDAIKQRNRDWYAQSREERRRRAKAYTSRHREENAARVAAWRRANPEHARALRWKRKAIAKRAEGSHTGREISDLLVSQHGKCIGCLRSIRSGFHVDHIQPLSKGGSNWISNIQLLCARCNIEKSAADPVVWAQRKGRLL